MAVHHCDYNKAQVSLGDACELTRELHNLLTLAIPIQRLLSEPQAVHRRFFQVMEVVEKHPGKSKKVKKAPEHAEKGEVVSASQPCPGPTVDYSEANEAWRRFVRDVLKTRYWMQKSVRIAKNVLKMLPGLEIDPASNQYVSLASGTWQTDPNRVRFMRHLSRYKVHPSILEALDHRLQETDGKWSEIICADTFAAAVLVMERSTHHFDVYVREKVLTARSIEARTQVLTEMTPRHHSDVMINCDDLPYPLNYVCIVVVIAAIVISLIILISDLVGSIVDWLEDDNRAREAVNSRTCSELRALSNRGLARLINRMLDGATLDDDENAILRILNCLPCERVTEIVQDVGRGRLLRDFDGEEWDRLMIRLQECGLAGFGDWDDDATRRFIDEVDCATINSLTLNEIRQLMLNLFDGWTGDDDERAIIRVIDCLDCETRQRLVAMRNMSVEDFDDEVDGDNWDRLRRRFRECDIR